MVPFVMFESQMHGAGSDRQGQSVLLSSMYDSRCASFSCSGPESSTNVAEAREGTHLALALGIHYGFHDRRWVRIST